MGDGVFVVEDEPHTRQLLLASVDAHPSLDVTGWADTATSALASEDAIRSSRVLLVDLGLPDGDGTSLIGHFSRGPTPPEILVVTVFGDQRHVLRAIEAGAVGYLLKDANPAAVSSAILAVLRGESPINPAIARHVLRRFRRPAAVAGGAARDQAPMITPREATILGLIARGFSNSEIAELLYVSPYTVNSHVKNLYRKLAVRSRSEAVFEAVQLGLVDLPRAGGD